MGKSPRRGAERATLRDVLERLRGGWPAGLTVLTGDDLYHLDRAQQALLRALAPEEDSGFALTVYGDDKVELAEVVSAARSVGMFSPRRVVFVSDGARLEGEPETLEAYAAAPPPSSFLIVRAPVLDQRRKLHQALLRGSRALSFEAPRPGSSAATSAVREMAGEKRLQLDAATAALLFDMAAGDLYRLSNELDKIAAWLGDARRKISAEIVREVASSGGLLSGWEIADAVLRRDRAGAIAAARRLVDAGEEPIRLIGGLAWRARVMLQARALLDAGRRPDEVVRETRAFHFKDALIGGVGRYRADELLRFPGLLLEADRTLKSRAIDPGAVLERLVDRMTAGA